MYSFLKRKKEKIMPVYIQMFFVFVAFLLMGALSVVFVNKIEREHLIISAEDKLDSIEMKLSTALQQFEYYLIIYSDTIRSMILNGESINKISAYMKENTNLMLQCMDGLNNTYGVYNVFGGTYISGTDQIPSVDYKTVETKDDVKDEIIISKPYKDAITDKTILTYGRKIFDDKGNRLATIFLDIEFDWISKPAIQMYLTESSYGMLLDSDLNFIAHPNNSFLGKPLSNC